MKKSVISLFIGALVLSASPAFPFALKNATIGVKAGLAMASIFGRDVFEQKFRPGVAAGGFLTYSLNSSLAVETELMFVMKGSGWEKSGDYEERLSLSYLEIPVLLRYEIPLNNRMKFNISGGPAVALKLKATIMARWGDESEEITAENARTFDFGLACGVGLSYAQSIGMFSLDLRYTLGLSTIYKDQDRDIKNGALLLILGYGF